MNERMSPREYQKLAGRTECDQNAAAMRYRRHQPTSIRLNHAVLGLIGEVGELAGAIERWLHYGKELDRTNLAEELGDCLWYIALACNAAGISLEAVMTANIDKLKARYPDKYTDQAAGEENRDRKVERKVVEQTLEEVGTKLDRNAKEKPLPPNAPPLDDNYDQRCSICGINPVHKTNSSGICHPCTAEYRG